MHLLLIEPEDETAAYLERGLREHGIQADLAADPCAGRALATQGDYDVVLLAVRAPEQDGLATLMRIRADGNELPILVLSDDGEVASRIDGFNHGADDCLARPFALAELVARVRSLQRRVRPEAVAEEVSIANFRFDRRLHCAYRDDRRIELTLREYQLLDCLVGSQGRVVERSVLEERVWGRCVEIRSNTVDVHVARLRRKIDRSFAPKLIHTVRGTGYLLEDRSHAKEPE